MKTKNESSLEIAVKLIKATKGKKNTSLILKEVFEEVKKLRND
jgi:hypothetical protein